MQESNMVTQVDEPVRSLIMHSYPGVWIQYKGDRARALQTAEQAGRKSLRAAILDEFRGDLDALSLTVSGQSMREIKIVWGTGQVRATYASRDAEFCKLVKSNILRVLRNRDALSERSIAQIFYAEGNSSISLRTSTIEQSKHNRVGYVSKSKGTEDSPSNRTPSTGPRLQVPSTTRGSQIPHHAPDTPGGSSNDRRSFSGDLIRPPVQIPPFLSWPRMVASQETQAPQILPPIYMGRDDFSGALEYREKSPPHTGTILKQTPSALVSGNSAQRLYPSAPSSLESGDPTARRSLITSTPRPFPPISGMPGSRPLTVFAQPALTAGACVRLADLSDESIVITSPVVRFLVIHDVLTFREGERVKAHEAYVTDGGGYTWIALASALNERVCNDDDRRSLQVGSTARISGISRLQPPDTCVALIRDFELLDASNIIPAATDQTPPDAGTSPVKAHIGHTSSLAHSDLHQERAARLLAEMKLREERKRRVVLERVLADVCSDLHRKNTQLGPATIKALITLDEIADAAMVGDRKQVGDK